MGLKSLIRTRLPTVYKRLHAWRKRATLAALYRVYGQRVAAGPFSGMAYIDEAVGSALLPKFVGSYECELHPVFKSIHGVQYAGVVDVGCAEGYYAVGIARMLPGVPIYAYDTDPAAQELCQRLAALNQVQGQVRVLGNCGKEQLVSRSGQRLFVLCDCEGYELDLFDAGVARALGESDLLVETHEMYRPGCTEKLRAVFAPTHEVQIIAPVPRKWGGFSATRVIPRVFRRYAVDEWRNPAQRWLWMRSISAASGTENSERQQGAAT
jgi:hypothetical protein